MASTTFQQGTVIASSWLNDVNQLTNHKTFPDGTIALSTAPESLLDSSAVSYVPDGVNAVNTTVQAKLRETVSVLDFGATPDWNGSTGTDNASSFVYAITYAHLNRKRLVIPAGRYSVGSTGIIYTAASIDNLEIYFETGVELVCTYSGANYPFILNLNGVGSNVKIMGHNAKLTYQNVPAVRGGNHAIYLFGADATIIDLEVSGFVISNAANMGVAVFAGPMGGTATGNKNVKIHDIRTINCKADGVHVENFDSGVQIYDIDIENPGDDSVCVSNYTGFSGAPRKITPTQDVNIWNIRGVNTYSALVRLLGVQRCRVWALSGSLGNTFGGSGASAVSCDNSGNTDYNVINIDVMVDGVQVTGGAGIFYYAGGGELRGLTVINATQRQGKNYGIRLLQSINVVGDKISDVTINNVIIERAVNSGLAGDVPLWADKIRNLNVINFTAINAPSVAKINGCDELNIDTLLGTQSGSTGTAFDITSNTNTTIGKLTLDGSCNFTTGVTATNNTNVWHTALWDFTGATNKLSRSGNTGVRGACQRVEKSVYLGNITAGTTAKQTFSENIFTGASYQLQATLLSDQGLRWGVTGIAADGFYVLYTDTMTAARINYVVETNVGY